jgi:hypothetical protein
MHVALYEDGLHIGGIISSPRKSFLAMATHPEPDATFAPKSPHRIGPQSRVLGLLPMVRLAFASFSKSILRNIE